MLPVSFVSPSFSEKGQESQLLTPVSREVLLMVLIHNSQQSLELKQMAMESTLLRCTGYLIKRNIPCFITTDVLSTVSVRNWRWKAKVQEAVLDCLNIHQQPDPQQDPLLNPCQSAVESLVNNRYPFSEEPFPLKYNW